MLPDLVRLASGLIVIYNVFPDLFLVLENQKLRRQVSELRKENAEMKQDYEQDIDKLNEEVRKLKEEIEFLAKINTQFDQENEQLNKDLD